MPHENFPNRSGGPVSSLIERIAPGFREKVDRAIIERDPPTLKDVLIRFQLRANGVSRSAFYRYAREVRLRAALDESAALRRNNKQARDLAAALRAFAASRLAAADLPPRTLAARAHVAPPSAEGDST